MTPPVYFFDVPLGAAGVDPDHLPPNQRLGEILRLLRERRGLTQGELAALCRVDQSRISVLENAKHGWKLSTLQRILHALGYQMSLKVEPADPAILYRPPVPRKHRLHGRYRRTRPGRPPLNL